MVFECVPYAYVVSNQHSFFPASFFPPLLELQLTIILVLRPVSFSFSFSFLTFMRAITSSTASRQFKNILKTGEWYTRILRLDD